MYVPRGVGRAHILRNDQCMFNTAYTLCVSNATVRRACEGMVLKATPPLASRIQTGCLLADTLPSRTIFRNRYCGTLVWVETTSLRAFDQSRLGCWPSRGCDLSGTELHNSTPLSFLSLASAASVYTLARRASIARMSAVLAEPLLLPNLDPSQVLGLMPRDELKAPVHGSRVDSSIAHAHVG